VWSCGGPSSCTAVDSAIGTPWPSSTCGRSRLCSGRYVTPPPRPWKLQFCGHAERDQSTLARPTAALQLPPYLVLASSSNHAQQHKGDAVLSWLKRHALRTRNTQGASQPRPRPRTTATVRGSPVSTEHTHL